MLTLIGIIVVCVSYYCFGVGMDKIGGFSGAVIAYWSLFGGLLLV